MPKTKVYEPEFKKKIVRLYLEEGRTIKSLNEEYQLGDETVRKWVRAFREECETDPELKDTKELYEEKRKLRKELKEQKKEITFLKKRLHSSQRKSIRPIPVAGYYARKKAYQGWNHQDIPWILWQSGIPDDEGLFVAGKHKPKQYNNIKIHAGVKDQIYSNT